MLGINAVVYRNTGTYGTPVWTAISAVESVGANPSYTMGDSNSRDSRFARVSATLANVNLTVRVKSKPADAGYEALMDALALAEPIDLLILDGPNTLVGARGIRGDMHVAASNNDQGAAVRQYQELTLQLADTDNAPAWARVGDGPLMEYAQPGGAFA